MGPATQFSIASIITVCRIRFSSVLITIDLLAVPSCPVVARCYACTTRVIPSTGPRPGKWPRPISRMPLKKTMAMTMPVHFAAARRVDGKCASSGVYAAARAQCVLATGQSSICLFRSFCEVNYMFPVNRNCALRFPVHPHAQLSLPTDALIDDISDHIVNVCRGLAFGASPA